MLPPQNRITGVLERLTPPPLATLIGLYCLLPVVSIVAIAASFAKLEEQKRAYVQLANDFQIYQGLITEYRRATTATASEFSKKNSEERRLFQRVTESAARLGLDFSSVSEASDGAVTAEFELVGSSRVFSWLYQLNNEFGIEVERIDIDRTLNAGFVSVRTTIYLP